MMLFLEGSERKVEKKFNCCRAVVAGSRIWPFSMPSIGLLGLLCGASLLHRAGLLGNEAFPNSHRTISLRAKGCGRVIFSVNFNIQNIRAAPPVSGPHNLSIGFCRWVTWVVEYLSYWGTLPYQKLPGSGKKIFCASEQKRGGRHPLNLVYSR